MVVDPPQKGGLQPEEQARANGSRHSEHDLEAASGPNMEARPTRRNQHLPLYSGFLADAGNRF